MSQTKKTVPLYQSKRGQVAGVVPRPKDGDAAGPSATWLVAPAALGGLVPAAGDRFRGADGVWWAVREVGPLEGDEYPLLCVREGGGA